MTAAGAEMRNIHVFSVILALAVGIVSEGLRPAAATRPVRFVIPALTQSYLLVARGLYSPSTWSLKFLYPAGWMLSTNPPGLYGVAPDLTRSGLGIFVTAEARGTTHFSFNQSPVLSGLVDIRSAVAQHLAQRAPGAVILHSLAHPPIMAGTLRVDRIHPTYRGQAGSVPAEGMLTITAGTYAAYGAYCSNVVAQAFQIGLDLPCAQLYECLSGLWGIFRTLSGSADRDQNDVPARKMMKALGGSAEAIDPAPGRSVPVPLGERDCWIRDVGHGEVIGGIPPPGPGWRPLQIDGG